MTEHTLVADLLVTLKEYIEAPPVNGLVLKHADHITSGIPDITTTFGPYRKTSWVEVKHAKPRIEGTGLQHLTARRLAAAGDCWYVIYTQPTPNATKFLETHIVAPKDVGVNGFWRPTWTAPGFDHAFVLRFLKKLHEVPYGQPVVLVN